MLESRIQKDIINYLKSKRAYYFRFQAQSNLNGIPDILCLYKGLFLGLELKTDKGTPTDLQLRKLKAINDNNGIGLIIRSVDELDGLITLIEKYEKDLYGNILSKDIISEWRKLYEKK